MLPGASPTSTTSVFLLTESLVSPPRSSINSFISSRLILSNEPDKVYNSTIFDKIDYQKLINFKKATVKFYTQPFKYLKDENEIVVNCSVENNKVINNKGLEIAKSIIKLEGSGTVELSINDINIYFNILFK